MSVRDEQSYACVGRAHRLLGMAVSPDDCAMAMRGLQTLGVRLDRLERTALDVARWLRERPEVAKVLHRALPDCPGHAIWARDFTGSASGFSIVLAEGWTAARTARFVYALRLFRIGFSWGGVTSLVMAGLEEPADLIADLRQALEPA